ncbi:MAG: AAA family ATPase [Thermoguttaceae bacterium]
MSTASDSIVQKVVRAKERIMEQLSQVIIGQNEVIEELLYAIFCKGHCLLEGVPGLAKTLLISSLAQVLDLKFNRIQFTPDLMPADITGIDVIEENRNNKAREYRFLEGPIFANLILADEINRTPPKTQSALLEAMQENRVSVGQNQHLLPNPFFVLATQNPIEQEGTYPLPEAQQDRFMFKIFVHYPSFDEEFEIVRQTTSLETRCINAVLSGEDILQLQQAVRGVPISDHAIRYALELVRQTRISENKQQLPNSRRSNPLSFSGNVPHSDKTAIPEIVREYVSWGAGPRAVQFLVLGAKARAITQGRTYVTCEDIRALAKPVLRHRLILSFLAESEGITPDYIIDSLVANLPFSE